MSKNKKEQHTKLVRLIGKMSRTYTPHSILAELSAVYEEYSAAGKTEAEVDYWLKLSRACSNLSSGAEKWLYEYLEELEDESESD